MTDREEISARYRAYCDVCQSGQLTRLSEFWTLPASFTTDLGDGKTIHRVFESYADLEQLYALEFGPLSDVNKTVIDKQEIKLYTAEIATVETSLSHFSNDTLRDEQVAFYAARKVDGQWMFDVHVSGTKRAA